MLCIGEWVCLGGKCTFWQIFKVIQRITVYEFSKQGKETNTDRFGNDSVNQYRKQRQIIVGGSVD